MHHRSHRYEVMILSMTYCAIPLSPLSVRSTNVYEEKSLGVFHDDDESEEAFNPSGNRATVWGRYLAMHARKQLSFGALDWYEYWDRY